MSNGWSSTEKKIGRRVFDAALERELAQLLRDFKAMAAAATTPADLWAAEEFLTNARKSIDSRYDFRYSQLEIVFGGLLRRGLISESELAGLSDEKLQVIVRLATLSLR